MGGIKRAIIGAIVTVIVGGSIFGVVRIANAKEKKAEFMIPEPEIVYDRDGLKKVEDETTVGVIEGFVKELLKYNAPDSFKAGEVEKIRDFLVWNAIKSENEKVVKSDSVYTVPAEAVKDDADKWFETETIDALLKEDMSVTGFFPKYTISEVVITGIYTDGTYYYVAGQAKDFEQSIEFIKNYADSILEGHPFMYGADTLLNFELKLATGLKEGKSTYKLVEFTATRSLGSIAEINLGSGK